MMTPVREDMSIDIGSEIAEKRLTQSLNENIEIENRSKTVSITESIINICEETCSDREELKCFEWKVWSDERPRSIGRVTFVHSDSFLYIKWTRVVVEGEGVATILWNTICQESNKKVFAKPVSEAMLHIANKIGFEKCCFNNSIVLYE